MKDIDFEQVSPTDIMHLLKHRKDKETIDRILKLKIFEVRDWKLIIPSFKCVKHKTIWKDAQQFSLWFPFQHQVFWYCLMDFKDIMFAITEVERIMKWEKQYWFPNGTLVEYRH